MLKQHRTTIEKVMRGFGACWPRMGRGRPTNLSETPHGAGDRTDHALRASFREARWRRIFETSKEDLPTEEDDFPVVAHARRLEGSADFLYVAPSRNIPCGGYNPLGDPPPSNEGGYRNFSHAHADGRASQAYRFSQTSLFLTSTPVFGPLGFEVIACDGSAMLHHLGGARAT